MLAYELQVHIWREMYFVTSNLSRKTRETMRERNCLYCSQKNFINTPPYFLGVLARKYYGTSPKIMFWCIKTGFSGTVLHSIFALFRIFHKIHGLFRSVFRHQTDQITNKKFHAIELHLYCMYTNFQRKRIKDGWEIKYPAMAFFRQNTHISFVWILFWWNLASYCT